MINKINKHIDEAKITPEAPIFKHFARKIERGILIIVMIT